MRKRGTFCSRKCSNSRTWTEEDRIKRSIAGKNSEAVKSAAKKGAEKRKGNTIANKYEVKCLYCEKIILTTKRRNKKICNSEHCRKLMFMEAGKASAASRKKVSKQEKELADLCKMHFDILENEVMFEGWDADILIPLHKTAILWNGPWHYKEMGMKNHSLKQVVNRDIIKIDCFERNGWNVLVFEDKHWTPTQALIEVLIRSRPPFLR